MIYKLLPATDWAQAQARGHYAGSADDRRDGYIHLSTRGQVVETAVRHFTGQTGLALLSVDTDRLGADLRWETSRGGALFPHLYGPLPAHAVVAVNVLAPGTPASESVAALLTC